MELTPEKLQIQFVQHLKSIIGKDFSEGLESLISPQLLSPAIVQLPTKVLRQAQNFVRKIYHFRCQPEYLDFLQNDLSKQGLKDPGNKSILMSYDFHLDEVQNLKLIEINTNASFLALGFEMYQMRQVPLPVSDFAIEEIFENMKTEMQMQGKKLNEETKVAIIDSLPKTQRLFAEFLLYQAYFKSWGLKAGIYDSESLPSDIEFIYNRDTDFYLERAGIQKLKQDFLTRQVCLSPNPYEYFLLADKQRLVDLTHFPHHDLAQANLPFSVTLNSENSEQLWADRKKFFFKPKRAFGAKQSYRGSSISRRAFDEITNQDFLAQEYIVAPELDLLTDTGLQKFKYDLRFYAYQDRVQMGVARLYQGQVTNLKTAYGGFAPIVFSD